MNAAFPTQPVAAISGGLGDIGLATAHALKLAGCRVALGDLRDAGRNADGFHVQHVDVASETSVQAWFGAVEAALGEPASIIVVNAGIVFTGSAMSATLDDWNRTVSVNLTGAWLTARIGARRLIEKKMPGRIVFVGSWAAHAPHVELAAYCAAKAGLRMLTQCLALELAAQDILVNEVAPGFVNAGLSGQFFRKDPALAARSTAAVPVGRLIEADEVAAAIAYLCSPAHQNLTGSTLLLDGGLSLLRSPANKP